jgi:hypothetical protein
MAEACRRGKMSQIIEALKKLDRESASKRVGWGPVATEVLKPGQLRPRKKILRHLIYVLLTAVVITSLIYGVTVKSGFLGKPPSPESGIPPAPVPQVAQIPRDVADPPKPLPPAPAKSPAPAQKITPPLVSGLPAKVSSRPPVQPAVLDNENSEEPPQHTPEEEASYNRPGPIELANRARRNEELRQKRAATRNLSPEQQLEASRQLREREANRRNLSTERGTPATPRIEGIDSPRSIPQIPGGLPSASPQAAVPSANASAGALPQLKISGIIWNEEPAMRRAVINGSFIPEGSQIEGVKVVEILPTSVRFSYKNRGFEISAFE